MWLHAHTYFLLLPLPFYLYGGGDVTCYRHTYTPFFSRRRLQLHNFMPNVLLLHRIMLYNCGQVWLTFVTMCYCYMLHGPLTYLFPNFTKKRYKSFTNMYVSKMWLL